MVRDQSLTVSSQEPVATTLEAIERHLMLPSWPSKTWRKHDPEIDHIKWRKHDPEIDHIKWRKHDPEIDHIKCVLS